MRNLYKQMAGKANCRQTKITFGSYTNIRLRREEYYSSVKGVEYGNLNTPPPEVASLDRSGTGYFIREHDIIHPELPGAFLINIFKHKGFVEVAQVSRVVLLDVNLYIGKAPSEEDHLPWLGVGNSLVLEITNMIMIGWQPQEVVVYSLKYDSPHPEGNTSTQIIGPYNLNRSRVLLRDFETAGYGTGDYTIYAKITGDQAKQTGDVYVIDEGSYVVLEALPPVIPDSL